MQGRGGNILIENKNLFLLYLACETLVTPNTKQNTCFNFWYYISRYVIEILMQKYLYSPSISETSEKIRGSRCFKPSRKAIVIYKAIDV